MKLGANEIRAIRFAHNRVIKVQRSPFNRCLLNKITDNMHILCTKTANDLNDTR